MMLWAMPASWLTNVMVTGVPAGAVTADGEKLMFTPTIVRSADVGGGGGALVAVAAGGGGGWVGAVGAVGAGFPGAPAAGVLVGSATAVVAVWLAATVGEVARVADAVGVEGGSVGVLSAEVPPQAAIAGMARARAAANASAAGRGLRGWMRISVTSRSTSQVCGSVFGIGAVAASAVRRSVGRLMA